MCFRLQTSELLSGKAFNSMPDILHFDVRNVSYVIIWTFRFFTPKMAPKPVLARDIPEKTKNS